MGFDELKKQFTGYFNLSQYLIPQSEAEQEIRDGVSFRGINILILIIAIFIASLGLNINSTAVIIGAMLISPLMGPIIGIGLAVGVHDFDLMKRSFRNLMMATLFSVLTSCVYFMISPVNEEHSELLARTSPTIYDVFIGFFGGTAGILAIGSRVKGNVIPGVAIATALMPPLCTVGYGLATLQMHYFFGALYLFFINSVFIALATTVGVRLMNYAYKDFANPQRAARVSRTVYTIALLTMLPAGYLTYRMFVENNFNNDCTRFVNTEFNFANTQVLSSKPVYSTKKQSLTITLVGQPLPQDSLMMVMTDKLPLYHLAGTQLRIIQGANGGQFDLTKSTSGMLKEMYSVTQNTISNQQQTIDSLRQIVKNSVAMDTVSAVIAPEIRVLFPQVADIAVSRNIVSNIATSRLDTINVVLVNYKRAPEAGEEKKMCEYIGARLRIKDVKIVRTNLLCTSEEDR